MERHEMTKMRREPVRRQLTVISKHAVTPRLLRIDFHSPDLHDFDSPSPDDHIKIFLPTSRGGEQPRRDFTPRAWNTAAGTLSLEFALHDHGPAVEWARAAQPGDTLAIGGPKGSSIVPDDFDWYLLLGDASALPSIARRLEGLRAGVPVFAYLLVADDAERQQFRSTTHLKTCWLHDSGDSATNADTVRAQLEKWSVPAGDGYIWIAGETRLSRELYQYLVEVREHPAEWVKAAAYWTAGKAE